MRDFDGDPGFLADGTPALDLARDPHEFLELQNTSAGPVSLAGWRISGGVDFTFPAGTTLDAQSFLVVARDHAFLMPSYGVLALSIGKMGELKSKQISIKSGHKAS